jgi:hypothetical protein
LRSDMFCFDLPRRTDVPRRAFFPCQLWTYCWRFGSAFFKSCFNPVFLIWQATWIFFLLLQPLLITPVWYILLLF